VFDRKEPISLRKVTYGTDDVRLQSPIAPASRSARVFLLLFSQVTLSAPAQMSRPRGKRIDAVRALLKSIETKDQRLPCHQLDSVHPARCAVPMAATHLLCCWALARGTTVRTARIFADGITSCAERYTLEGQPWCSTCFDS